MLATTASRASPERIRSSTNLPVSLLRAHHSRLTRSRPLIYSVFSVEKMTRRGKWNLLYFILCSTAGPNPILTNINKNKLISAGFAPTFLNVKNKNRNARRCSLSTLRPQPMAAIPPMVTINVYRLLIRISSALPGSGLLFFIIFIFKSRYYQN